jgi:hypothetical protein
MINFDPAQSPTEEPTEFVSGDLVMWRRTDLTAYVSGYALSYSFRPAAGGALQTVAATVSGTEFRVSTSPAWAAGIWYWQAHLVRTSDSARIQIGDGQVNVLPALSTTATDTRSHAVKMLSGIELLMEGKATSDVLNYTIGGRQINKMSPEELIKWRSYYRNEVRAEQDEAARQAGKATGNTITARFV